MAKKIQSITPIEAYPNPASAEERVERYMLGASKLFPLTKDFPKRMALTVKKFYEKNPGAIRLTTFTRAYGIAKTTFYDWMEKYPEIKEAVEDAKEIIEERRLFHYSEKSSPFHQNAMLKDLRRYSKEWHEVEKEEAALKSMASADSKEVTGNVTINLLDLANEPKESDVPTAD